MMNSQKGIIHLGLIIVLLIFGIGVLGYVAYKTNSLPVVTTSSPTPEAMMENVNTTNWKTYTNEDLSFQYPIDLDILEENSSKIAFGNSTFNSPIFEIRFSNFSKVDKNTSEEIELGYKQAVRFATSSSYVVQTTEKPLIELRYATGDSNSKETNKQLFDQILSTFEFVQDTSNWKTLSYKKFSMQYPSQWQTIDASNERLFPLKERFNFSTNNFKALVLNKKDIYLIISIEDEYDGGAGGVFLSEKDYQEFTSTQDEVKIDDSTFYIGRSSNKIPELKVSHGGPYTWSFLSEYLPQKKTVSGNIRGYENVIKRNGFMYNFVLASTEGGLTDEQTQQELISMLKTINW